LEKKGSWEKGPARQKSPRAIGIGSEAAGLRDSQRGGKVFPTKAASHQKEKKKDLRGRLGFLFEKERKKLIISKYRGAHERTQYRMG